MSKAEKSLRRLLSKPTDFTWAELRSLMEGFGYALKVTGGSSRKFVKPASVFAIHEPHPHNMLKAYQIRAVIAHLEKEGEIQ